MFGRLRVYKLLALAVIFSGLFSVAGHSLAYEVETHGELTAAAVKLFNDGSDESWRISDELSARLVKGAKDEDGDRRYLNHFYDPVYDRGLVIGKEQWLSSKKWAQDAAAQLAFIKDSLLGKLFKRKTTEEEAVFTWQKAIEYYQNGDKDKAFLALGHVLHLLQDVTVPDHTRNDAHPAGSPYEKFSGGQEVVSGGASVVLNGLDAYFDRLAGYSNNNFYSKDTIEDKAYSLPQADYEVKRENGFVYGVKVDVSGEYLLYRNSGKSLLTGEVVKTIAKPEIMEGYWERLSKEAVASGTGLIHLFLQEADPEFKKYLVDRAKGVNEDDKGGEAGDVSLEEKYRLAREVLELSRRVEIERQRVIAEALVILREMKETADRLEQKLVVESGAVSHGGVGGVSPIVGPNGVIFSTGGGEVDNQESDNLANEPMITDEAAGSGNGGEENGEGDGETVAVVEYPDVKISNFLFDVAGSDEGREFIELYNAGVELVALENWSIQTIDKKKNFESGHVIEAGGYFIIRLNGDPIGEPAADMIWKSGSLKNSADKIYLVGNQEAVSGDDDSDIVDQVAYDAADYYVDFIKDLKFYPNATSTARAAHVLEIYFDEYPFVPETTNRWKVLAFYKNQDPDGSQKTFGTFNDWQPNSDDLLKIWYWNYAGMPYRYSLILPDMASGSGSAGGILNSAYDFYKIGDGPLYLEADEWPEFLTIAYYDFVYDTGQSTNFDLVGVSRRYYLK